MTLRNILANNLAGSNNKLLTGIWLGAISPDIQWIKWLDYETKIQKELKAKEQSNLTKEETKKLSNYIEEKRITKLFKLYGISKITKSEYIEVYHFMKENNIEEYMLSKLTKKELKIAKKRIIYYSQLKKQELKEKIKNETKYDTYQSLSHLDAFILYFIIKINMQKEIKQVEQEIDSQIKTNETTHQKGLYYAKNSFVQKK